MTPFLSVDQPRDLERTDRNLLLFLSTIWVANILLWAWVLWSRPPAVTDYFLYIYPDRLFSSGCFRSGFLPLWNPYVDCGIPELGYWHSSCLYPFYWVFSFLPSPQGLCSLCVIHSLIAGFGFFWWMRQRAQLLPSLLGAVSFAGSAIFIRDWCYPSNVAALAWIPWIFGATDRYLQQKRSFYLGLAAGFLCLQVLAGYPLFVLYTVFLLFFWLVDQKAGLRQWAQCAGALLGVLVLTCAQWLPFLEFATYAGRGGWKDFPYFDHLKDYALLLDPLALGLPGSSSYQGATANFTFNLYFGLIALLFALFAAVRTAFRRGPFWSLAALFFLLWMAGPDLFLWRWISEPLLEKAEPSKAVGLFIFCAATLASFGFDTLWRARARRIVGLLLAVLSLLWVLDISSVPWRVIHPIPDLYRDREFIQQAKDLQKKVGDGRFLSLSQPLQFASQGPNGLEMAVTNPARALLSNANEAWGLRSTNHYLSMWVKSSENIQRYTEKGFPYRGDLLEVAGVRLLLLPQKLPAPRYRTLGTWEGELMNWDDQASKPLRWVKSSEDFPNAISLLDRLAQPQSGWREKVYFEKAPSKGYQDLSAADRPLALANDPAENPNHASIRGTFPDAGYVVFNESFAPGWHAWVDGQPRPIRRAYGLFMAVPVEKGTRQVDWRYEPTPFRLGLFLSLLGLAGVGGLFWRRLFHQPARL